MTGKPIICLDFDGVIHSYEHGWRGGELYGTVTPGFFTWALEMRKHFRLVIFSSRTAEHGAISDIREWLHTQFRASKEYAELSPYERVQLMRDIEITVQKPPALISIDDRAIRFDGDWRQITVESIKRFKPWTQKLKEARSV